ncbi:TPA: hypothetical protein ACT9IY_000144 [Legionella pneumophila]|nr:hypothetical protein [Legionella pneumophila]
MFIVALLVLGFFIIRYYVKTLASINSKLNVFQKDLSNIQKNTSFLLELKSKVVDSLSNMYVIEHDIKNIKSKIERIEANLTAQLINETPPVKPLSLDELKDSILRVEKYILNQQNKFNDVLAKEIFALKKDMAHIITKLTVNFPPNDAERCLAFKHLLSSYPKSIPRGFFRLNEDNYDEYAVIFLDFPRLDPFEEINAKKLFRANSDYDEAYYEEDEEFYIEQGVFESYDPHFHRWSYNDDIPYNSRLVLQKGIEVYAHVFEVRSNRTHIWQHPAEIISVKWGEHHLEVTIKMWSPDDEKETIRIYEMFTHEATFPYVTDDEPDHFRRKFPFISGFSGFSFQKPDEATSKDVRSA